MSLRTIIITAILSSITILLAFKLYSDPVAAQNVFQSSSESKAATIGIAEKQLTLHIIARTGPWPYASRLIGYRGRLWFANSVKYKNHNSADIWSLDPQTLEKRLERNLFSQDAGTPIVSNNILYWPLEDALLTNGNGVIASTNGDDWQNHNIDTALIYHTSEVHEWRDGLLAVTGARNAGLHYTQNGGKDWQEIYDHETPRTHISRIRNITHWNDVLYATLRDEKTQRLVKWTGTSFETIKAWPLNRLVRGLTLHRNILFAIIGRGKDAEIWRYDGNSAQNLGHKAHFIDLTTDGTALWAVTRDGDLFSLTEKLQWRQHARITGGIPYEITAIDGAIYVAGAGNDKRSIIWGPKKHVISDGPKPSLLNPYPVKQGNINWDMLGAEIDAIISNEQSYTGRRNPKLSALMERAIKHGAPSGFFAKRLETTIPDIHISTFGGNAQTKASDIIHNLLLRSMAQSGHPNIPVKFLKIPWSAPQNSYEKYLALPLSALKAIADTGQNDRVTIAALIARLDYDDPDWFRSQVIGTLTAVTGKHYGYDSAAWQHYYEKGDSKDFLKRTSRP